MARISMTERLKKSGGPTVAKLEEASKRLHEQSKGQSGEHTNGQSGGHSDTLTDNLAGTVADTLTVTQLNTPKGIQKGTPRHTLKNTLPDGPGNNPYFWMTPNQALVLGFINTIPSGKTRLADICNGTGVPYGTVRKSLVALERNDCITKPKKIRIGQWQGMHVELLDAGKKWNTLKDSHTDSLLVTLPVSLESGQSDGHSGGQSSISSSSYINKTTTKEFSEILANYPELGYWRDKGLTVRQINTWTKQFDLNHDDIIQSLCYCRFDMVENDREKSEPINDVFNWFFRILERTGTYPKPTNYKSHQEKKVEREKERAEEIKRQVAELKKTRQEALHAQHELEFEQMLQNTESAEYRKCHDQLTSMLKNPRKKGSISFINAMKKAFCEFNDIEPF